MGCYEREQAAIAAGTGQRGDAARAYFAELDKTISDEASCLTHRPDYTKTLFAPENDDIYQEFCRYVDQPEPRYFDTIENPMCIEGWTAAEIYRTMIASNPRIVALDAGAIYGTMVTLRTNPALGKKVLEFKPTCLMARAAPDNLAPRAIAHATLIARTRFHRTTQKETSCKPPTPARQTKQPNSRKTAGALRASLRAKASCCSRTMARCR